MDVEEPFARAIRANFKTDGDLRPTPKPIKIRPTPIHDRRPGTSADAPSPTSMIEGCRDALIIKTIPLLLQKMSVLLLHT